MNGIGEKGIVESLVRMRRTAAGIRNVVGGASQPEEDIVVVTGLAELLLLNLDDLVTIIFAADAFVATTVLSEKPDAHILRVTQKIHEALERVKKQIEPPESGERSDPGKLHIVDHRVCGSDCGFGQSLHKPKES